MRYLFQFASTWLLSHLYISSIIPPIDFLKVFTLSFLLTCLDYGREICYLGWSLHGCSPLVASRGLFITFYSSLFQNPIFYIKEKTLYGETKSSFVHTLIGFPLALVRLPLVLVTLTFLFTLDFIFQFVCTHKSSPKVNAIASSLLNQNISLMRNIDLEMHGNR